MSNEAQTYGAIANISLLAEFDPPPLFVVTVEFIDVGGSRNLPFNSNRVFYQKVVGGFNSQTLEIS